MSERLFTCDVCIREGHEEVGCHRPNELIQAGENVVCQGCLECGEFPELEDLPQERFVPPEDKRIQQLTDELQWLQDNHVRVCSRKSKLDLRIQQLTDGINRAGAYLSQGEPNIARETLAALLPKEKAS